MHLELVCLQGMVGLAVISLGIQVSWFVYYTLHCMGVQELTYFV